MQLFVISNGTLTKYYSNTVRDGHLAEQRSKRSKSKTSNSFRSPAGGQTRRTSRSPNWSVHQDLFRQALATERPDLLLRDRWIATARDAPYQIVAAERIPQRIGQPPTQTVRHRRCGWLHLAHHRQRQNTGPASRRRSSRRSWRRSTRCSSWWIARDLDYQTMREYERFEKGRPTPNTSTAVPAKTTGRPQLTHHHHHHHPEAFPLRDCKNKSTRSIDRMWW